MVLAFVCVRSHRKLGRHVALNTSFSNISAFTNFPDNLISFMAHSHPVVLPRVKADFSAAQATPGEKQILENRTQFL